MANEVEIIVSAIDKASSVIGGFKKSWTELSSAINLAEKAIRVADKAYDATIGTFVSYARTVSDMSRATGMGVETTSRLIQIADDVKLSVGSLETAMKRAIQQGIDPSLEGLQKLADKYNSIIDPIERSKFLLETFGRSGLEMGKLLEKGSQGIIALNNGIEKNLILTDNAVKMARAYEIVTDKLNDKIEGFKTSIGQFFTPGLISMIYFLEGGRGKMNLFSMGIDMLKVKLDDGSVTAAGYNHTIDNMAKQFGISAEWANLFKLEMEGVKNETLGVDGAALSAKTRLEELNSVSFDDIMSQAENLKISIQRNLTGGVDTLEGMWKNFTDSFNLGLDSSASVSALNDIMAYEDLVKYKAGEMTMSELKTALKDIYGDWTTVYGIVNDIDGKLKSIPKDVWSTIHVTIIQNIKKQYSDFWGEDLPPYLQQHGGEYGIRRNAMGGRWGMIPSYAGYEGMMMPGNRTAGAGESVTVTPAYEKMPAEISKTSMREMASIIKVALKEAIGLMN